jgi:hypothetical protein
LQWTISSGIPTAQRRFRRNVTSGEAWQQLSAISNSASSSSDAFNFIAGNVYEYKIEADFA